MSFSTPSPDQHHDAAGPRSAGADKVVVLQADDFQVVGTRGPDAHRSGSAQRVTAARGSHSDDVARRMRTYAISMGIRTLCVVAAILAFPHWYAWLFVPGAVLLPYISVVLANVGGERVPTAPAAVTPPPTALRTLGTSGAA